MSHFSWLTEDDDISDILLHFEKEFIHLNLFCNDVLRKKKGLPSQTRETIAAYVSGVNACSFCYGVHSTVAKSFGQDDKLLGQMVESLETANVDAPMKSLLCLARKLTLSPTKVVKADIAAILDQGYSEDDAHEVIVITGLFNMMNRIVEGHGVKGSNQKSEYCGKILTRLGYKFPWIARKLLKTGLFKKILI